MFFEITLQCKGFQKMFTLDLKKIDMDNLVLDLSNITCETAEVAKRFPRFI